MWTLINDECEPEERRVLYALDFLTGMRAGEAAARRWRDLDSVQATLLTVREAAELLGMSSATV